MSTDYMRRALLDFREAIPTVWAPMNPMRSLILQPALFLDNALLHKKTIRNYGEFMAPAVKYRDATRKGLPIILLAIEHG